MLLNKLQLGVVFLVGTLGFGMSAQAAFTFQMTQSGPSVIVTGNGTLNLAGLTSAGPTTDSAFLDPQLGILALGATTSTPVTFYSGCTGSTNFGSGGGQNASAGTGPIFLIAGVYQEFAVPVGYVSGSLLSDSATFNGSFASLGITPGVFTWTWGTGASADSLTVTAGAVPEPASFGILCVSPALMMFRRRRGAAAK